MRILHGIVSVLGFKNIYMLMGYIYCHSESMFVALNFVVRKNKNKMSNNNSDVLGVT